MKTNDSKALRVINTVFTFLPLFALTLVLIIIINIVGKIGGAPGGLTFAEIKDYSVTVFWLLLAAGLWFGFVAFIVKKGIIEVYRISLKKLVNGVSNLFDEE